LSGKIRGAVHTPQHVIDGYADRPAGRMRIASGQRNHDQTRDPVKATNAIVDVVESEGPPLRLQLGRDTIAAVEAKVTHVQSEFTRGAQWPGPPTTTVSRETGSRAYEATFGRPAGAQRPHSSRPSWRPPTCKTGAGYPSATVDAIAAQVRRQLGHRLHALVVVDVPVKDIASARQMSERLLAREFIRWANVHQ